MIEKSAVSQPFEKRRFPCSLGSILLWVAIVGLAIINVMTYRELEGIRHELHALRETSMESNWPLPAEEVARQFKARTTLGPISTLVRDVRYSPKEDSYKVEYSCTNDANTEKWSSDVILDSTGYGRYSGEIRWDAFTTPLGYDERFVVSVETPSPLAN